MHPVATVSLSTLIQNIITDVQTVIRTSEFVVRADGEVE